MHGPQQRFRLADPPLPGDRIGDLRYDVLWGFGAGCVASAGDWQRACVNLRKCELDQETPILREWQQALARELWFARAQAPAATPAALRDAWAEAAQALGGVTPLPQENHYSLAGLLERQIQPACALFPIATHNGGPAGLGQVWVLPGLDSPRQSYPAQHWLEKHVTDGAFRGSICHIATTDFTSDSWGLALVMAVLACGNPDFAKRLAGIALCSGTVDAFGTLGPVALGNKPGCLAESTPPARCLFLPSSQRDHPSITALNQRLLQRIHWVDTLTAAREAISGEYEIREDNLQHHLERCRDMLSHAGSVDEASVILERIGLQQAASASQTPPRSGILSRNLLLKADYLQAHITLANHRGQSTEADDAWKQCLDLEAELLVQEGLQGLEKLGTLQNNRAVSLMDQGRFAEAMSLLDSCISRRREILHTANIQSDALLGKMLGTSGQLHASAPSRDHPRAEAAFREAMTRFPNPRDRDRQWIYLGHLACDAGPAALPLWQEAQAKLFPDNPGFPVQGRGSQFLLALQAKGLLVFGTQDHRSLWLRHWQESLRSFPAAMGRDHPFGLIFQNAALLAATCGTHAEERFSWMEHAIHLMDRPDSPSLQRLAHAARIRRCLLPPAIGSQCNKEELRSLLSHAEHNPLWPGHPAFATPVEIQASTDTRLRLHAETALSQIPFHYC